MVVLKVDIFGGGDTDGQTDGQTDDGQCGVDLSDKTSYHPSQGCTAAVAVNTADGDVMCCQVLHV